MFHAFMFEGEAFSGLVTTFNCVPGGAVEIAYSYQVGVDQIFGSFRGTESEGRIVGAWEDQRPKSNRGRSPWKGNAQLAVVESEGRKILSGSWSMPGVDERWMLDVGV